MLAAGKVGQNGRASLNNNVPESFKKGREDAMRKQLQKEGATSEQIKAVIDKMNKPASLSAAHQRYLAQKVEKTSEAH